MSTTEQMFLTVKEVAALYGVGLEKVRVWIRTGHLPAHKRGKKWYVLKSDVVPEEAPAEQTDP